MVFVSNQNNHHNPEGVGSENGYIQTWRLLQPKQNFWNFRELFYPVYYLYCKYYIILLLFKLILFSFSTLILFLQDKSRKDQ